MPVPTVEITYRRLGGRVQLFRQFVLESGPEVTVTFLPDTRLESALTVDGATVLESGSPVIWFTYPGEWHDIGRFHLADGTFTGIYANVLTPVRMEGLQWETTDLCLDVWRDAAGVVRLLDEEDLQLAESSGWVDAGTAHQARHHARELLERARAGDWPPAHVAEWDLPRARSRLEMLQKQTG